MRCIRPRKRKKKKLVNRESSHEQPYITVRAIQESRSVSRTGINLASNAKLEPSLCKQVSRKIFTRDIIMEIIQKKNIESLSLIYVPPMEQSSPYTRSIAGNAVANCAHKNGAGTTILIRVYTGVSSTQQGESERRDSCEHYYFILLILSLYNLGMMIILGCLSRMQFNGTTKT